MKKLTFMLVLIICLSLPVLPVFASEIFTEGDLEYTVNEGSITIIGYFGTDGEITIPSSIAGYPVNSIAKGAFVKDCLVKVNLPSSVINIEEGAFGPGVESVFISKEPSYAPGGSDNGPGKGNAGEEPSGYDPGDPGSTPPDEPPAMASTDNEVYAGSPDGKPDLPAENKSGSKNTVPIIAGGAIIMILFTVLSVRKNRKMKKDH